MRFPLFNRRKSKKSESSSCGSSAQMLAQGCEQGTDLAKVFEKLDANGDGKISVQELHSLFAGFGEDVDDEEMRRIIKAVDEGADGSIDLNKFVELCSPGDTTGDASIDLQNVFSIYDLDKNGTISAEELQQVFAKLGERFPIDACQKMICGVDRDGDGVINLQEFRLMMQHHVPFASLDQPLKESVSRS